MRDHAKLKELALAANASVALKMQGVSFWVSSGGVHGTPQTAIDDFQAQANPAAVLGLIKEIERLRRKVRIQQRLNESAESIRKDAGGRS